MRMRDFLMSICRASSSRWSNENSTRQRLSCWFDLGHSEPAAGADHPVFAEDVEPLVVRGDLRFLLLLLGEFGARREHVRPEAELCRLAVEPTGTTLSRRTSLRAFQNGSQGPPECR